MVEQTTPEEIIPGLAVCRHGNIYEYTITQMSPAVADAWAAKIKADVEALPSDARLFTIYDISALKNIMIPSYLRETMQKMAHEINEQGIAHQSYQAMILPRNFMTHFVRMLLNSVPNMSQTVMHVFFTRDEGFQWIQSKVKQHFTQPSEPSIT